LLAGVGVAMLAITACSVSATVITGQSSQSLLPLASAASWAGQVPFALRHVWHDHWHDGACSPKSVSAFSALRCGVSAGRALGAVARHPRNAQVVGSIPTGGSQTCRSEPLFRNPSRGTCSTVESLRDSTARTIRSNSDDLPRLTVSDVPVEVAVRGGPSDGAGAARWPTAATAPSRRNDRLCRIDVADAGARTGRKWGRGPPRYVGIPAFRALARRFPG